MGLRAEILDQPRVVARLIVGGREPIARIGAAVRSAGFEHVVIAARGTSDHAAIYAQYLFGVRLHLAVGLAAPSITSLYGVEPDLRRALVLGISQSGASPDVVGVVAAGRRQGAPTIAITNCPDSPLARAAEHVVDLGAGPERAVAATKTYTAELVALALLADALAPDPAEVSRDELPALPDAMRAALAAEPDARAHAHELARMHACAVLGRGYDYATAREWALKLKELARVVADPYSAADFRHGPLALVEPGFPVLAIAPSGAAAADLATVLASLRDDHGADLLVVSDRPELRALGSRSLALAGGVPEALMPVVSIIPAQLFAFHLALAGGHDPERPRHLRKVTLTR